MRTIFGTYPCARTRRTAPAAGARRGRGGRAGRATAWSERLEQARDGGDRVCAGAGGGRGRGARGRGRVLDGGPPAEQDVVHRRGEQGPVQGSSKASSQGSEPGVLTTPGGVRAAHEDARDAGRDAHLYSITSTVSKPPPLLEASTPGALGKHVRHSIAAVALVVGGDHEHPIPMFALTEVAEMVEKLGGGAGSKDGGAAPTQGRFLGEWLRSAPVKALRDVDNPGGCCRSALATLVRDGGEGSSRKSVNTNYAVLLIGAQMLWRHMVVPTSTWTASRVLRGHLDRGQDGGGVDTGMVAPEQNMPANAGVFPALHACGCTRALFVLPHVRMPVSDCVHG